MRSLVVVPLTWLALACEDPLKEAQRLEEPRVIGVRVVSASGAASLTPGEGATAEVLAAGPRGPLDAALAFRFCEAAASDRGVPYCATGALTEGVTGTLDAAISLEVPPSVRLGARLAFLGVACVEGEPELAEDPLDWRCRGAAGAMRTSFDAWIRTERFSHDNPDLSGLALRLAGAPLALQAPSMAPTCTEAANEVATGATHALEVHLGERAREPGDGSDAHPPESLQLSHFSSAGSFERPYSFIPYDAPPEVSIDWRAPAAGTPVKLYLVVRDGRGGVSWVSASVCAR